MSRHFTNSQIDELIGDLDRMMDRSSALTRTRILKGEVNSSLRKEEPHGLHLILPSQIWKGFLEYCEQNELDPVQQVREAAAAHHQDLLKTYKIRMKLDLVDEPDLV